MVFNQLDCCGPRCSLGSPLPRTLVCVVACAGTPAGLGGLWWGFPYAGGVPTALISVSPCVVGEIPSLEAYPNPPSGCRLNPTVIEESPKQIDEDACDRWFPLALEQGSDNEEEEIGVLERRELHHSPISVAASPAPPEPRSGTTNRPMLVKESPVPHDIMVEDSPAPHYIVVEESSVPMSGVKNRPCLVVQSLEPTEDRASTTCPVPVSGTKVQPSLVDDSLAGPKVNNLCLGGGENPVERGSATLPINFVSPPATTIPVEDPQPRVLPHLGGGSRGCNGLGALFCFPSVDPVTYGGS